MDHHIGGVGEGSARGVYGSGNNFILFVQLYILCIAIYLCLSSVRLSDACMDNYIRGVGSGSARGVHVILFV